ncbi:hypothetical protein BY458DRAFT_111368 [Sporodiniella umbellata]|nr:hypothetical protein BY458DRAFT_111368 [Sporodiniella umbellata]
MYHNTNRHLQSQQQILQHVQDDSLFNQHAEHSYPTNATSDSHLYQFHNYLLQQSYINNTTNQGQLRLPSEIAPHSLRAHSNVEQPVNKELSSLLSLVPKKNPIDSLTQSLNNINQDCKSDELTSLTCNTNLISATRTQQQTQQEPKNPKPYGCGIVGCLVNFDSPSRLFYHLKNEHIDTTKTTPKPFRCAIENCSKTYKNLNGLQYHVKESKGAYGHNPYLKSTKIFQCSVPGCQRAYRTPSGLRYHQRNSTHFPKGKTPSVLLEHQSIQQPFF